MAINRMSGVHADIVDGTSVLIDAAGTHVVELNAVGSLVWQAIDGQRDVTGLVAEVMRTVTPGEATTEQVSQDVSAFLDELRRLNLVQT